MALASGLPRLGFCRRAALCRRRVGTGAGLVRRKATADPLAGGDVQGEAITPFKDATHYNNFYEFGPNKGDPAENASALKTEPWSVVIDGEVGKPGTYALEDFVKPYQLEERIYRLRCVEAWSMVIPWLGFPLADLLKRVEPNGQAKFVRFRNPAASGTDGRPTLRFLGDRLALYGRLAHGRGDASPGNAGGGHVRAAVAQPEWRAVAPGGAVEVWLQEHQVYRAYQSGPRAAEDHLGKALPPTSTGSMPTVNPQVDHPRWSQARERRLPSGLFSPNVRDTQMFNGYGVRSLPFIAAWI